MYKRQAVDYVTRIMEEYPHAILCTNTEFADYPFNAVVSPEPNGEMSVRDYFSHELITHEWICDRLAENSSYRVCVEYSGLDCLKWVNNCLLYTSLWVLMRTKSE